MPETPSSAATLLNGERLYSPAALAKVLNIPGHRGGAHLNGSTIFRHITKGVRAANGERIRLEGIRLGTRWLSSVEAVARFAAKLTASATTPADIPPPSPTPRAQRRAAAAASAKLDALGIK